MRATMAIPGDELDNRFAYHPPKTPEVIRAHERIRAYVGQMATEFNESLPDGREKATALTKLEEAMFWANAAIARNN